MGAGREVILEFQRLGNAVKVTATDPETLVEVSIMGPARSPEAELRRTALDKLDYVLRKRSGAARPRSAR
jgi:hypothetical protein